MQADESLIDAFYQIWSLAQEVFAVSWVPESNRMNRYT
jgi:hypothetical protein